MSNFPPSSWLGHGLDMTVVSPNDIDAATSAILTAYALIPLDPTTTPIKIADVTWNKPKNVDVATDVDAVSSELDAWMDGATTAKQIKADSSLSAQYMAVSGDASVSYSVDTTFQKDRSYALFSYNHNVAKCQFASWGQSVDKLTLAKALSAFNLQPFNPKDTDIIASYRNLFGVLGSHIVVGATYGGRLQMSIFASNKDSSYESSIIADIGLQYNGLCPSGKFDGSIASTDQFKTYSKEVMQQVSCRGGDIRLASSLNASYRADDVYKIFTVWTQTANINPGVMNLHTAPLWEVMVATFDRKIIKHSKDVKTAYEWIMENPAPHWTKAVVTINSDWGEFGITSPNASLIRDPEYPPSVDNLVFSGSKIVWGKEHSHAFQRDVTINFIVVNDGSPLNFELSHGSDGSSRGSGRIDVNINGTNYSNASITDNNWNSQFYYNAPVNANAHVVAEVAE